GSAARRLSRIFRARFSEQYAKRNAVDYQSAFKPVRTRWPTFTNYMSGPAAAMACHRSRDLFLSTFNSISLTPVTGLLCWLKVKKGLPPPPYFLSWGVMRSINLAP